jgi:gliding motility-associated-like protein
MLRIGAAVVFLLFLMLPFSLFATHNRAGEITYRHISGYTYEVTILTYTYSPSPANRDSLPVNWGDGSPAEYLQIDQKVFLPNNVRYNTYAGLHTYPGPGTYTISMQDPNRNAGIVNMPGSVNIAFYIESQLVINPFLGPNSSPVLLSPPMDNACVFFPFLHNPTAWDPDGDSLSYSLIHCKGANGFNIPSYSYPSATNSLSIDPVTGDFIWDSPQVNGEFNIAILIEEWRHGVRIGYVMRDMQIFVTSCNNLPPVIAPLSDTCVVVGENLTFPVSATDPNNQQVTLSAAGGPLSLTLDPATFPTVVGHVNVTGTFQWTPGCNAVRRMPHGVTFKAVDNGVPVNMFDIKSIFITVIAPPVDTVEVYPLGGTMVITWSQSPCPQASGYSIYRKVGTSPFQPGPCITGVPEWTGYKRIGKVQGIATTLFIDDNNGQGLTNGLYYCYRIVADFPDGAQSLASHEACSELIRDVPIITHVTVDETDNPNGAITLRWLPPKEIDSTIAPGPYLYLIYRTTKGNTSFQLIDSVSGLNDTVYLDTPLNTVSVGYVYRIDLYNNQPGNRFRIGSTKPATSVFLTLTPGDRRMNLSWDPETPWENTQYVIYRQDPLTSLFDSIATTPQRSWSDEGLSNGTSYCYMVRSSGSYGAPDIVSPLLNWSQAACGVPADNVAPCPPELTATTDCASNHVQWGMPPSHCGADIAMYQLWFSPGKDKDYTLIYTSSGPFDTSFFHQLMPASIIGCYKILGIDSTGNIGEFSKPFCIDDDSCDTYRIPNVFTPNGDGRNDLLIPFPYSNVERINLSVMSRWGNEVFSTNDPDINWNGTHQKTGEPLSAGVYYYVCDVYFFALEGIRTRTLSGTVTILR